MLRLQEILRIDNRTINSLSEMQYQALRAGQWKLAGFPLLADAEKQKGKLYFQKDPTKLEWVFLVRKEG
jgi:hypothetical protein